MPVRRAGEPKRAGQAELQSGGLQGERRGAVFDKRGHLFGAAEISLMNDAGVAVYARAVDDVIVEVVAFLLGDERCHTG
jgi:hypothetical protein